MFFKGEGRIGIKKRESTGGQEDGTHGNPYFPGEEKVDNVIFLYFFL